MLPFIKCTRKTIRSAIASILMMSGWQQCVFFWSGRVRPGLEAVRIVNSNQRGLALRSAPDIGGWLPPGFTTQNLIRSPISFGQRASHSFYSLVSTNNNIKYSSSLLTIMTDASCSDLLRVQSWSHPETDGGAKSINSLLSDRQSQAIPGQKLISCSMQ